MPPRKPKRHAKAVVSEEEKQKKELLALCKKLKDDAEEEARRVNDFQQQKERINEFWQLEKEKRDELALQLREKEKTRNEVEENQEFVLKTYQQKLDHLRHEHVGDITDTITDAQTGFTLLLEDYREEQHQLKLNIRQLEVAKKEMQLGHIDLMKDLRQQQEKRIMELRVEFEQKGEELRELFGQKETKMRESFTEKKDREISMITKRKDKHISELMAKHKQAFKGIKDYYHDITTNNLDLIKQYKKRVVDMTHQMNSKEKLKKERERLFDSKDKPLHEMEARLERLTDDHEVYKAERLELKIAKNDLDVITEKYTDLTWEHDVLEQKFDQLKIEHDELRSKLDDKLFEAQQKTGFKNLVLEKKLTLLGEKLEKTDAVIGEVLKHTNLPPAEKAKLSRNLKDMIAVKDKSIREQEERLDALRQEYYDTIRAYEDRLLQYGISPAEFGFTPPDLEPQVYADMKHH